jgi:hypothetical protein
MTEQHDQDILKRILEEQGGDGVADTIHLLQAGTLPGSEQRRAAVRPPSRPWVPIATAVAAALLIAFLIQALNPEDPLPIPAPAPVLTVFDSGADALPVDVDQTADGTTVLTLMTDRGEGPEIVISSRNADGSERWTRNYSSEFNIGVQNSTILSSGDIVVSGYTTQGNGRGQLLLLRLDSTGTIVWKHTIGGIGPGAGGDVIEIADGDLLVSGYVLERVFEGPDLPDIDTPQTDIPGQPVIVRLNGDGIPLWTTVLPATDIRAMVQHNHELFPPAITALSDGRIVVAGWYAPPGSPSIAGRLFTLTPDGRLLSQFTYRTTGSLIPIAIAPHPEEGVVVTGIAPHDNGSFIAHVHATGDIAWAARFTRDNGNIRLGGFGRGVAIGETFADGGDFHAFRVNLEPTGLPFRYSIHPEPSENAFSRAAVTADGSPLLVGHLRGENRYPWLLAPTESGEAVTISTTPLKLAVAEDPLLSQSMDANATEAVLDASPVAMPILK